VPDFKGSTDAHALSAITRALADRYLIERELGQGGMATVYLAHDIKHERKVALKVLKPELAAVIGAERFVVEIRTTAALQHPHILPLFDSGSADGFLYYVMPFIDGETLRAKLDRETQLGVDESVRLATDVADALQYAHEQGIIHRDIKPENILLHKGRPMVADFGIALALSAAAGGRMTETGLSLGTPHYMSPEQATAEKEISARSDVYSLASVLYEMLAGNPPHTGSSAQQIIMKIITEQAQPVTQLRKSVPPNVAAALAKALEKLPADRFESARAFAAALGNAAFTSMGIASGASAHTAARWKERLAVPLAIGLVAAVATAAWAWQRVPGTTATSPALRTLLTLPDSAPVVQQEGSLFAISKDGSRFVYVGPGTGDRALWTRPWNALTSTTIPGSLGGDSPFLSTDGETVAFYLGGTNGLYSVSMRGGARQSVALDSTVALGGDFGPDGAIYFSRSEGLRRAVDGGKTVEQVTAVNRSADELRHGWADVLPNGKGALFTIQYGTDANSAERSQIAVVDFKSHAVKPLFRGVRAQYSSSGHIVFADHAGGLFAIEFDQDEMLARGGPLTIVSSGSANTNGVVDFTLASTGTLVYRGGNVRRTEALVWVDRQGKEESIDSTMTGPFDDLALSPDGRRLAVTLNNGRGSNIWIKDLGAGGTLTKLTVNGIAWGPGWTRDGSAVTYVDDRGNVQNLMRRRADGGDTAVLLLHAARQVDYGALSADSAWIVYVGSPPLSNTKRDLFARRVTGDTSTVAIAVSPASDVAPRLSPDGRWIAYASDESGAYEVFTSPFPNVRDARIQVSVNGGTHPLWSADGRELFYFRSDGMMMAATVNTAATLRILDRKPLFNTAAYNRDLFYGLSYDVSRDGRRFVMSRVKERGSASLILLQNWMAELTAGKLQ
jgi:eukaryotic-like serine/threonine-protein kinase